MIRFDGRAEPEVALQFTFDGVLVPAPPGQSIAAVLLGLGRLSGAVPGQRRAAVGLCGMGVCSTAPSSPMTPRRPGPPRPGRRRRLGHDPGRGRPRRVASTEQAAVVDPASARSAWSTWRGRAGAGWAGRRGRRRRPGPEPVPLDAAAAG